MNRSEALEIADRVWRLVNGPTAGTTDPEALERVETLTEKIRENDELSANLKLKADEVAYRCRILFDEEALAENAQGDVKIAGALARNAIIKLRLVAERQLPARREEGPAEQPEAVEAGQRAWPGLLARRRSQIGLGPVGAT